MKFFLVLFFAFSHVYAQASIDWRTQVEAQNAQLQFIKDFFSNPDIQAISSGSTDEKANAKATIATLEAHNRYLNNPAVIKIIQQQEQQRPQFNALSIPVQSAVANTPEGYFSAQTSPQSLQLQSIPSNYQQIPLNYQTKQKAPSSLRPSVRYPAVKNSLNKPDSILKDIVGPYGGGLRALFRELI